MEQTAAQPRLVFEDFFVGDWLVQPSLGVVVRVSDSTHLEPKTMQVLMCLATRAGTVLSKDELLRSVWPETFVSEHVLTHAIWQLRQIFGSDFIQTIPRRGYRLTALVRTAVKRVPTLAVLPLANLSRDAEQDYFAEGMTDAMISALAQIGGLRVISRTSVMQYRDTEKPVPQIGAELHADYIIEGAVIRTLDRVRVSVQLINAANDHHVWAKNFDRTIGDILALEDEVARSIAKEIQVALTPQEDRRLARAQTVNPEAHELYLKGRYCYFRTTERSLRMSVDYMQRALELDPDYALAHAGLATSLSMLSSAVVMALPPIKAVEMMRPAVLRSLELDPDLPEAYEALGWIKRSCDWDWTGAEAAYRRAIALNPSYAPGYGGLGFLLLSINRKDEAIAAWRQACTLDPLSLLFQCLLAFAQGMSGQLEQSIAQLQKVIQLEPAYYYSHLLLSAVYSFLGRHEEAITSAEMAFRLCQEPSPRCYLGYVYTRAGQPEVGRRVLSEIQELEKVRYITPGAPAALLVTLGEFETALDYIEQAQAMREPDIAFIRSSPQYFPLHGHSRFQELVKRMNFPE